MQHEQCCVVYCSSFTKGAEERSPASCGSVLTELELWPLAVNWLRLLQRERAERSGYWTFRRVWGRGVISISFAPSFLLNKSQAGWLKNRERNETINNQQFITELTATIYKFKKTTLTDKLNHLKFNTSPKCALTTTETTEGTKEMQTQVKHLKLKHVSHNRTTLHNFNTLPLNEPLMWMHEVCW